MTVATDAVTTSTRARVFLHYGYFHSMLRKMSRGDNTADSRTDHKY
jgi:hypothetical protein